MIEKPDLHVSSISYARSEEMRCELLSIVCHDRGPRRELTRIDKSQHRVPNLQNRSIPIREMAKD
jgi:hypothetical protein